jgi:hypothetical protein
LPREAGNGWKLPTFHNTMHMVDDMCKYGKPKEANTEVGEKNNRFFAKQRIDHHCRKQHKSFTHQVSVRLSDSFVIEKLASAIGLLTNKDEVHCITLPNHQGNDNEEGTTFGATYCSLHLDGNNVKLVWLLSTEKHFLTCDAAVVTFLKQENYMSINNHKTINCCTEYKHNNLLMWCHPSFQGEGPQFDWVSVYFEACTIKKKKFPKGIYPFKVVAILPKQHNSFLGETEVIVQCAGSKTKKDSVLFEERTLMDGYYTVLVAFFLETLFVLAWG